MAATMRLNTEKHGIELLFPDEERPSIAVRESLKKSGFRWHHTGKYWFARQTEERLSLARQLADLSEPVKNGSVSEPIQKTEHQKGKEEKALEKSSMTRGAKKASKEENTFAAVYDSIGDDPIWDHVGVDITAMPRGVYCKEDNVYFRHTWGNDECIKVTDLTNAGKTGKSCMTWSLYAPDDHSMLSNILADQGIERSSQLVQALRDGKSIDGVKFYSNESKGIDVFSPFVEVKPLKTMPDEWNKRNFTNALLSGQIYMGQLDYHYTDDYAMDAAYGFGTGRGVNIPYLAQDVVEDWSSSAHLHMDKDSISKDTCFVSYSEHSNKGYTLQFDLNCDIREGKRRADERAAGIENYNAMMKASCIQISPESIDEKKVYTVSTLDTGTNTGIYGTKEEQMQGSLLKEYVSEDWDCLQILSAKEFEIVPDKLYEISCFSHPRSYAEQDERVISFGNSQQVVTGKALSEMTAEGISLPYIREAGGEVATIELARENLNKFIRGFRQFMITDLSNGEYQTSLDNLNREASRAGHVDQTRSKINDLISAAQNKAAQQNQGEKTMTPELER